MAQDFVSVSFALDSALDGAQSYILELDPDYFLTVNEIEKSIYIPVDEVFLKAIPSLNTEGYNLFSSLGNLTVKHTDVFYEMEETILFKNSLEESLNHIPQEIVSYSWSSTDKGTPVFSDAKVTLSSEVVGILTVVYTVKGDRLSLTNCNSDKAGFDVLCLLEYTSEKVDVIVPFENEESSGKTDVTLMIKDVITEEVISGAAVQIMKDELIIFNGNADSDGNIVVPDLIIGETYDILTTATNYFSSEVDYLNNDTFTVPDE